VGRRPAPSGVAAELVTALLGAARIDEFLTEVAQRAVGLVNGGVSCGITVQATARSPRLAATSDEFAARMDAVQYEVDDGPCLHCLREGIIVEITDIAADTRWPAFARRSRQEGAKASMSIPMLVHDAPIGALNLYTRRSGGLSAHDSARGRQFADHAAGAVALAARLAEVEDQRRHLQQALSSRSTIDQAMGIIMAQTRLSAEQAFDVLRRRSQQTNVKLRDIALRIIADTTDTTS
jgi:GAF domain-containing protein